MYNLDEFVEQVKNEIGYRYKDSTVKISKVTKNNGIVLNGLMIMKDVNISPTIYLEYFYSQYKAGKGINEVIDEIVECYEKNKIQSDVDMSFFFEYEKVKERITFKLVNYEKNRELLKHIPHFRYLDLAIIFHYVLENSEISTILIYNTYMEKWKITKNQLYDIALVNTPQIFKYQITPIDIAIREMLEQLSLDVILEECLMPMSLPMFSITNHCYVYGANCILYPNLLKEFAEQVRHDLYIIPSSIHEVLLIPDFNEISREEIMEIIKDVNDNQVSDDEVLSYKVYRYSRKDNKVTM